MGIKRQEHTVNSKRHVSPPILSTDCCGKSTNAAATLPSCSVASRGEEHRKIIPKNMIFTEFLWQQNKKVIDFDIFLGHHHDLPPPSVPLWGSSQAWDSLRMRF